MTVVPIRLHRRTTPAAPLNHSATICPGCLTLPLRQHGPACPEVPVQRPRLAYPAEARVFRGLLIGVPAGAAFYAALIALIGALS